jgi:type II secretory pathway pseudopilin PulG
MPALMIGNASASVAHNAKRGITLLEVIISLGILSVGLASVVALIPAGGSQAKKAVIEDRRGAMAAAAMADLVTRGMLDQSRWTTIPAAPFLIDPLGGGGFAVPGLNPVTLRGIPSTIVADEVFRSPDDLVYTVPDDDTVPASPKFFPGPSKRMTEGLFSWLATLVPVTSGSPFYRLSVVEFHRRPTPQTLPSQFSIEIPSPPPTSATPPDPFLIVDLSATPIALDDFKTLFPVGSIVLCRDAASAVCDWARVIMAAPEVASNQMVSRAELTVDRRVSKQTTTIYAIEGAVGLAERTVRLEEMSPWSQ